MSHDTPQVRFIIESPAAAERARRYRRFKTWLGVIVLTATLCCPSPIRLYVEHRTTTDVQQVDTAAVVIIDGATP